MLLDVFVLALTRVMLDSEHDNLIGNAIEGVVHKIRIFSSYQFAHALQYLPASKFRKQNEVLQ